jgi:rare lipoprotein A
MNELTAAHRSLPLHTMVRVTNLDNDLTVLVRINDRGPFTRGRIIDISHNAALQLGMAKAGVAEVRIEVFNSDQTQSIAEALPID